MSLKPLLDKIKQADTDSRIEIALVDSKYLPGQTVRRNQGIENLRSLTKEYGNKIAKYVIPVFTNDQVPTSNFQVVYDVNTFYQDMVKSVSSFVSGRMDPLNIAQVREFMFKTAKNLGIMEFNAIDYTNLFTNAMTPVAFAHKLKENFQKSGLNYFADAYLRKVVSDRLLELNADGDYMPPTFLVNAKPEEFQRISEVFSGTYTEQNKWMKLSDSPNLKEVAQEDVKNNTHMGQESSKKIKKGKQL